ncbi:MAG: glycosyltransferase [Sphingobacteriaceae bacterium]
MKIFHVITRADLGGAQSIVINLVKKSIENGHQVYVLTEQSGAMWSELPDEAIKVPLKSLIPEINPIKDLLVILALKSAYRKYKPDVIHLHSSKIGALGRMAFPAHKIIYTIHGFDSVRVAFRKFLIIEKMLKNQAKHIVGVSRYDLDNLEKEGIYSNTSCVYNGIIDWPAKNIKNNTELKSSNLSFDAMVQFKSEEYFIVLCIARLSPPKRFDLFCEIATQFAHDKVKFIWIGNQQPPEQAVPHNVVCLGEIRNAHQYIPFADVCMLTSDYEGMPISIIEALAYSKAVLASDVGGVKELLDGQNGYALPNNAALFAEKIRLYKHDHTLLNASNKAARISYDTTFTIDKMYNKYLELYKDICDHH